MGLFRVFFSGGVWGGILSMLIVSVRNLDKIVCGMAGSVGKCIRATMARRVVQQIDQIRCCHCCLVPRVACVELA